MSLLLPKSLNVNGKELAIRYQYEAVLDVIRAFNDPELEDSEKAYICLYILYEDFDELEKDDYEEALRQAERFIDNGIESRKTSDVKMVDFEQDAHLLFSAVNRVAGKEVRECENVHWWTFLGWFMEIGECTYSTVLNIRSKRAKGKSLEKWEKEFYSENKEIVEIKPRLTQEEIEAEERLNKLLS